MPVAEARARILADLPAMASELVALPDAHGRVLAEDVSARLTQPPLAVSAMDGYAVRAADVASVPVELTVVGAVPAGGLFEGTVGSGEAVRITAPSAACHAGSSRRSTANAMSAIAISSALRARLGRDGGRPLCAHDSVAMEGATATASTRSAVGARDNAPFARAAAENRVLPA